MSCKVVFVRQVSLQSRAGERPYGQRTGWGAASPPGLSAQPWRAALFNSPCLGGSFVCFMARKCDG